MDQVIIWGEISLIAFLYKEMYLFDPKGDILPKLSFLWILVVEEGLQLFSTILVI